jgi:pimeloyl-ACP methyl ester carboxylesterase
MNRPDGHVLARPDAMIHYWTSGPPAAPIVLFLHGATLDHRAWGPQAASLQDRHHVVVTDLRGHGASTGRFEFHAAVEDTLALLDRLPLEPVVLVGLSLGANIAQEVIRRRPERVHALVAADTTCNTAARHPLAASMSVAVIQAQAALAGNGYARQAAWATAVNPQVREYVMEVNAHRSNQETVEILTSLLTTALHSDPGYRFPVPALLVHGKLDRIGDIATTMPVWAQREPLARYAAIPNAGHASNLDNPDEFTALLEDFLEDVLHPIESPEAAEERAEELYRRYGARPWHLVPEGTREHYRGLVAAGIDGQGRPLVLSR